jgi:hypothetical protein
MTKLENVVAINPSVELVDNLPIPPSPDHVRPQNWALVSEPPDVIPPVGAIDRSESRYHGITEEELAQIPGLRQVLDNLWTKGPRTWRPAMGPNGNRGSGPYKALMDGRYGVHAIDVERLVPVEKREYGYSGKLPLGFAQHEYGWPQFSENAYVERWHCADMWDRDFPVLLGMVDWMNKDGLRFGPIYEVMRQVDQEWGQDVAISQIGASQKSCLDRIVKELKMPRRKVLGSMRRVLRVAESAMFAFDGWSARVRDTLEIPVRARFMNPTWLRWWIYLHVLMTGCGRYGNGRYGYDDAIEIVREKFLWDRQPPRTADAKAVRSRDYERFLCSGLVVRLPGGSAVMAYPTF